MKSKPMWLICWGLYWTGHIVSKFGFLYPVYNWVMLKSCKINDDYGFDVWEREGDMR